MSFYRDFIEFQWEKIFFFCKKITIENHLWYSVRFSFSSWIRIYIQNFHSTYGYWIKLNFQKFSLVITQNWKKNLEEKNFFFKLDLKIFFDSHFMVVFHAELEYELRIFLSCTVPEFDWKNQKMFILQANSTKNSFLKKFFIVNSKEFLIEDHHLVQFFHADSEYIFKISLARKDPWPDPDR